MATPIEEKKRADEVSKLVNTTSKLVKTADKLLAGAKDEQVPVAQRKQDAFLKRKGPAEFLKEQSKKLGSILKTNQLLLKESIKTRAGKGKLAFGGLLALGGLAGFILTGKKEFLNNVTKALTKYSPFKILVGIFDKALVSLGKPLLKGIGSIFKNLGGSILKIPAIEKLVPKITKFFKPIGTIAKTIGGIFKGFSKIPGAKALSKIGTKGGGKAAGKQIPVIGSILAVIFGIQRFKKGDVLGGIMELASGAVSLFPPIGLWLGPIIDGLIILKDIKGAIKPKAIKEKKAKAPGKKKDGFVGLIVKTISAITKFTTNPLGAMKDAIGIANIFFPGLGDKIGSAVDWVFSLGENPIVKKFTESKVAKTAGKVAGKVKGAFGKGIGKLKSLVGDPLAAQVPGAKPMLPISGTPLISNLIGFAKKAGQKGLESAKAGVSAAGALANRLIPGLKFFNKDIDVSGVQPDVWHNFTGMVQEYFGRTKGAGVVQLNSAFRSIQKQKELFSKAKPGFAAPPGKSLHNFGYALDINSKEANAMAGLGLMEKWGFHQPFKKKEPWHIEPRGIDRQAIKTSGLLTNSDTSTQIGDPVEIQTGLINQSIASAKNTASRGVPRLSTNGIMMVQLADDTINKLAAQIAKDGAKNVPVIENRQSLNIDARG